MARRIRILHLRQASGGGGGADTVLMDWLGLLDREGFEGAVAYLPRADRGIEPIALRLRERGLTHHVLPGGRLFDPGQFLRLRRLARGGGFDIVHCHDPKADVYGRLLRAAAPGLRLAATLHAWHVHSWRSGWYKRLDLLAVRGFDLVTAVAADIAAEAARAGLRGVHTIPNGVNLARWTPRPPRAGAGDGAPFTVGFAARLSREKGVEDFVAAARRIADAVPGARFVVAGEGPERGRMQALAEAAGLGGAVEFAGFLDEAGMRGLYGALDVLLHPSHSEGTPMSLLEAAAVGTPLVATLVGGVGDVFRDGDTARLLRPGDAAGLAEAVIALARAPQEAGAMAARARAAVERGYDMADRVRLLEALYRDCLGREAADA